MLTTKISIRKVVTTIKRSLVSILTRKKKIGSAHLENITQHERKRRETNSGKWKQVHCDFDKRAQTITRYIIK